MDTLGIYMSIRETPSLSLYGTLQKLEVSLIVHALIECDWNIAKAARRLKVGRTTLSTKIKRLQIMAPKPGDTPC